MKIHRFGEEVGSIHVEMGGMLGFQNEHNTGSDYSMQEEWKSVGVFIRTASMCSFVL